ncbi:MAG: bifunctional riboflavin kinase/FAD synthetase [Myxococcales bacterium]|nr:bifunctional riboflavin kinase/FAD synthetase [Myxococcales bacterium]MDD9965545.1 bifunctional riboflavin kinase/FAD synthetase [Myxococcales bacterium]
MQGNRGQVQSDPVPTVLAPGNYDGVHRGHQALLARARAHAATFEPAARTCVLTFDPHPLAVLAAERAPIPLTTPKRRRELLLGHGIDEVVIQPFDQGYAAQSPEEFVRTLLTFGTRAFVVGHDFRFGKRAAGDAATLEQLGQALGFSVLVEGPVAFEGARVSSSAVRQALSAGDVTRAAALQDRYHDVSGTVVQGDQRGRQLGFPTANLVPDPVLTPADGVYAVMVRVLPDPTEPSDGPQHALAGVANLGTRPTFAAGRSIEVHLFDVDRDLYGKRLRVAFVTRLRAECAFPNTTALKQQITADCTQARHHLAQLDPGRLAWI